MNREVACCPVTVALRIPAFRRLALLYTLNGTFEWVGGIALMVVVYGATESALAVAAMLLCKHVLPGLLTAFAGRAAERAGVRAALTATFAAHAGAFFVAASGFGPAVFPLAVIAGTCAAVARAVLRTEVGRVLTGAELRSGNAVLNVVMGVVAPAAPAIGALVAATSGAETAAMVSAFGFAVMSVYVLAATPARHTGLLEGTGAGDDDEQPLRKRSLVPVSWLVALGGAVTCIYAIDEPLLLAFSDETLGAGIAGYGAICTVWAVGITAGSMLFTRLLQWSMLRVYALATTLFGGGLILMGSAPSVEFACAAAFVAGIGAGMDWVAITTAVQESAPKGQEAHYITRLEAFATAGPGIGLVIGGVVAELASPRAGVLLPGVLSLAVLILGALAVHHRNRQDAPVIASPLAASITGGSK